jgi:hypothetical protein
LKPNTGIGNFDYLAIAQPCLTLRLKLRRSIQRLPGAFAMFPQHPPAPKKNGRSATTGVTGRPKTSKGTSKSISVCRLHPVTKFRAIPSIIPTDDAWELKTSRVNRPVPEQAPVRHKQKDRLAAAL